MWGDSEKCQERRDGRERDRNKNAKYRRDAWNKGKWKKIRPKSQNNKSVWSILLTFSNAITMPISLICPKHTSVAAERRTMSPRWLINKSHTQNCWLWVPWNILHTKSSYQMYRTALSRCKATPPDSAGSCWTASCFRHTCTRKQQKHTVYQPWSHSPFYPHYPKTGSSTDKSSNCVLTLCTLRLCCLWHHFIYNTQQRRHNFFHLTD